jgi:hypothetical protein
MGVLALVQMSKIGERVQMCIAKGGPAGVLIIANLFIIISAY